MRPVAKAGVVALGYIAAFALAWLVVDLYIASTNGQDRQTYGMMYAFGDDLLFLGVFGLAGIPVTALALFFLRPVHAFWRALSLVALAVITTSVAAFVVYVVAARLGIASTFVTLRMFVAPMFAIFFFLSGAIAPNRSARTRLLVAMAVELTTFTYVAVTWFRGTP
jgi:hypothetical protein